MEQAFLSEVMLLSRELPWAGSCFPELFVLSSTVVCPAAAAIYHCQQLGPYLLLKSTFEVLYIRAARKIGNVVSGGRLDSKEKLAPLALSIWYWPLRLYNNAQ